MKKLIFELGLIIVYFASTQFAFAQTENTSAIKNIDTSANAKLQLPPGFTATIVAEGLGGARHIAVNKQGDLYVKLSKLKGRKRNYLFKRYKRGRKV
jgi:hypothetical protein